MRYRIGTLAIALMIIGTPARGRAQTQVDTIQGRITTDSGRTVTGADIIVTRAPDRMGFRAVSDSSGFYRVIIAEGTGDYLVHISATGRDTFRKRVLRGANGSTIVVDAKLASAVHQLSSVQVTAQIPKPTREPPFGAGIGAAEKVADGVTAAIPPDAAGDLAAIAGSIPGVSPQADGGFSVGSVPILVDFQAVASS